MEEIGGSGAHATGRAFILFPAGSRTLDETMTLHLSRFRLLLALAACLGAARLPGVELDPIGPGSFAVGSTNLEVTDPAGNPMIDYLNGKLAGGKEAYLTDILANPTAVLTLTIDVPNQSATFGAQAGGRLPVVIYVLYPTRNDNLWADYRFPYSETGDAVFPHMQKPGEPPIFAAATTQYPLIVYSGGYNTHGLWHLAHLKNLAAHGYIVVDVFHGDARTTGFNAALALRPIELRAALDRVLQDPGFSGAIDRDRIGASGASAGGHTILSAMGGFDPADPPSSRPDPRIKAGFGLVPFMGGSFGSWPFQMDAWLFGRDHAGLRGVRTPFFAIYAQNDRNVPPGNVEAGLRELGGPTTAVLLDGETHDLSAKATSDDDTWEILFFDAWLRGDADACRKLAEGTTVKGGVHDHKTYEREAH